MPKQERGDAGCAWVGMQGAERVQRLQPVMHLLLLTMKVPEPAAWTSLPALAAGGEARHGSTTTQNVRPGCVQVALTLQRAAAELQGLRDNVTSSNPAGKRLPRVLQVCGLLSLALLLQ